ncbi:MAG: radical SAM protein [Deltaproteobacteria bacterium]|nr:radical SAM protein [Deltaproteobacteria bacterium]
MERHPREILDADLEQPTPVYTVWELTLRCDQACAHCGSRAGLARVNELDTEAILETGRQLVALGCREVTLIGGEIYLRDDLVDVVRGLTDCGLWVSALTGGRRMDAALVGTLKDAGLKALSVSIDGLQEVHEKLRRIPGGYVKAMGVLHAAMDAGVPVGVNTQINRVNMRQLRELATEIHCIGVRSWQVQLTVPMGRAADRPELVLQPWEVLEVIETLAAIQEWGIVYAARMGDRPFDVFAGDNIGYYGPHELILRTRPGGTPTYWMGCHAGKLTAGVQADGTIKPCLSLPTEAYICGSILEQPLEEIWVDAPQMAVHRERTVEELWGFCRTCDYAVQCLAGCPFTQHATMGRRGNNPYCWHRAETLRQRGVRERLVRVEAPPGGGFDFGRFEIVEEPWPDVDG